jgi:hypothetical protein
MNGNSGKQGIPEGPIARTTKRIAYVLLGLYGICLIAVAVAAFSESPSSNRVWFDLFKSGFLLLGGALTTVIGYYFGSRGTQEAETTAGIALKDRDRAREELAEVKGQLKEEREKSYPTYDETSLEEPKEL